jgi:hypothetical protein
VDLDHAIEREGGNVRFRVEAVILCIHVDVVHVQQECGTASLAQRLDEVAFRELGHAELRVIGDVLYRERPAEPLGECIGALCDTPKTLARERQR